MWRTPLLDKEIPCYTLLQKEIPFYRRKSLNIGGNPLLYNIIPYNREKSLLYQKHKHNSQLTKITNIGKCSLVCTGIHILKNACSRAGENIILTTLNVTSDMDMVLSPACEVQFDNQQSGHVMKWCSRLHESTCLSTHVLSCRRDTFFNIEYARNRPTCRDHTHIYIYIYIYMYVYIYIYIYIHKAGRAREKRQAPRRGAAIASRLCYNLRTNVNVICNLPYQYFLSRATYIRLVPQKSPTQCFEATCTKPPLAPSSRERPRQSRQLQMQATECDICVCIYIYIHKQMHIHI